MKFTKATLVASAAAMSLGDNDGPMPGIEVYYWIRGGTPGGGAGGVGGR